MDDDLFYYALMWFSVFTPLLWLGGFFMLRKSDRGKILFWITFSVYLAIAVTFYFLMDSASGWDGLGYLVLGCMSIAIYTLFVFVIFLVLRKNIIRLKNIQGE
jgi:hypothetical protein